MDRFIVFNLNDYIFNEVTLKSNMDRFIGRTDEMPKQVEKPLKSNMDRFIALLHDRRSNFHCTLKSNMDRFIAVG